jgi:hypothetical protein
MVKDLYSTASPDPRDVYRFELSVPAGKSASLLKSLNISPANWLTDLKNDGTADIEGTKTIHISGSVNISKLVADQFYLIPFLRRYAKFADLAGGGAA